MMIKTQPNRCHLGRLAFCAFVSLCFITMPQVSERPLLGQGAGAADKQIVDAAAAERGKTVYIAQCITCHGAKARGSETGPDLVRSTVVLRDRVGSEIGPFLRKGHATQTNTSSGSFTPAQMSDLSHFLKQRVNDTLRSSPLYQVQNVLTGDAKAGAAYFTGAGKCGECHSPGGDLAGIGKKYDPPTLQQRFLFPRRTKPVTVTVTPAGGGAAISGVLDRLDDFSVSLRDPTGEYHSWSRTSGLKVEKRDPLAAHIDLLDKLADKDMHDVVRYLETLK
jgi:cytochrome c oxidase cbb3-type subunit 3